MATVRGRELIIQKPTGSPAPNDWANVCGVDKATLTIENQIIESKRAVCTDRTAAPVYSRKYGAQTIKFAISGAWDDDANGKVIADACRGQTALTGHRVIVPGDGTYTGDWLVTDGNFDGDLDNDLQASWNLVNTGAITYVAA